MILDAHSVANLERTSYRNSFGSVHMTFPLPTKWQSGYGSFWSNLTGRSGTRIHPMEVFDCQKCCGNCVSHCIRDSDCGGIPSCERECHDQCSKITCKAGGCVCNRGVCRGRACDRGYAGYLGDDWDWRSYATHTLYGGPSFSGYGLAIPAAMSLSSIGQSVLSFVSPIAGLFYQTFSPTPAAAPVAPADNCTPFIERNNGSGGCDLSLGALAILAAGAYVLVKK